MSLISKSSRAVLVGGALFALPLLLLIVLGDKAIHLLKPIAKKLVDAAGIHSIFGAATVTIVCVLAILLICYISGLLLEKGLVRQWSVSVEEKLWLIFPRFQMLKFQLLPYEKKNHHGWQPVLLQDNTFYRVAFITDQSTPDFVCVFLPDAPKLDAGEVRYIRKEDCTYYPITMQQAVKSLHRFGRELPVEEIISATKKTMEANAINDSTKNITL